MVDERVDHNRRKWTSFGPQIQGGDFRSYGVNFVSISLPSIVLRLIGNIYIEAKLLKQNVIFYWRTYAVHSGVMLVIGACIYIQALFMSRVFDSNMYCL